VFYTIDRFHHAGGLAKPIARLAAGITENNAGMSLSNLIIGIEDHVSWGDKKG